LLYLAFTPLYLRLYRCAQPHWYRIKGGNRERIQAVERVGPVVLAAALALSGGGNQRQAKSPDVKDNIKQSLQQAGLRDVSVDQDRDEGAC
jgi:hypothetical protein